IDEDEAFRLRLALTSEVIAIRVSCADGPEGEDVGVVIFGDIGHGDGVCVDIQTARECARLWHGCPPSSGSSCCDMRRRWLVGKLTRVLRWRSAYPSEVIMSRSARRQAKPIRQSTWTTSQDTRHNSRLKVHVFPMRFGRREWNGKDCTAPGV